ncbi:MAG: PadR family transcriptional regulator [bacterium]|nr:PadR family transcriptional regulator [bacterium]
MSRKARTPYALLGLLSWKPMSGYDIKKIIEIGLSHFWSESYGQIYPVLNRLVEEGMAHCTVDPTSGNRGRKVYKITRKGRNAFAGWLHQPGDLPRLRDELKLKFFLTSRSNPAESLRLLEEYRDQQREHLATLRESERLLEEVLKTGDLVDDLLELRDVLGWATEDDSDQRRSELMIFYLTLRNGVLVSEVRIAWADEALSMLRRGTLGRGAAGKVRIKGVRD